MSKSKASWRLDLTNTMQRDSRCGAIIRVYRDRARIDLYRSPLIGRPKRVLQLLYEAAYPKGVCADKLDVPYVSQRDGEHHFLGADTPHRAVNVCPAWTKHLGRGTAKAPAAPVALSLRSTSEQPWKSFHTQDVHLWQRDRGETLIHVGQREPSLICIVLSR